MNNTGFGVIGKMGVSLSHYLKNILLSVHSIEYQEDEEENRPDDFAVTTLVFRIL